jgi:hypothetical protein
MIKWALLIVGLGLFAILGWKRGWWGTVLKVPGAPVTAAQADRMVVAQTQTDVQAAALALVHPTRGINWA